MNRDVINLIRYIDIYILYICKYNVVIIIMQL